MELLLIWIATIMTASASIVGPSEILQEISEQNVRRTRDTSSEYGMTEECLRVGLCEDAPNYPSELAEKLIKQLGDTVKYLSKDELSEKQIMQRTSGTEQRLCPTVVRIQYPRIGMNKKRIQRRILNRKVNPIQGVKVEMCLPNAHYRSQIVNFASGWSGECVQSYIYRKMAIIDENNKVVTEEIKVPYACSCYGVPTY